MNYAVLRTKECFLKNLTVPKKKEVKRRFLTVTGSEVFADVSFRETIVVTRLLFCALLSDRIRIVLVADMCSNGYSSTEKFRCNKIILFLEGNQCIVSQNLIRKYHNWKKARNSFEKM